MGRGSASGLWASLAANFHRRGLRLLGLLIVLGLLLASSLWPSPVQEPPVTMARATPCLHRHSPRVVSHRGVDEDSAGGTAPSTAQRLRALLDAGITSFDVDLFWAADDGMRGELFVGHPPSLRKLWALPSEVHLTSAAELRQHAHPEGLLTLTEMMRILTGHQQTLGQVSLELKFPSHPEWQRHLATLYRAARGLASHVAVVANDAQQAAAHRAAQRAEGLHVPILVVVRDNDAPVGADGKAHANLSAFAGEALFEGWSASWKVLDPALRHASTSLAKPLAVWVCDREPELRHVWTVGAEDVVTNRPLWAREQLRHWAEEERARCKDELRARTRS